MILSYNLYVISLLVFMFYILIKEDALKIDNSYFGLIFFGIFFLNLIVLISYIPYLLIKLNDFNFLMIIIYYIFTYNILKLISAIVKKINKKD